MAPATPSASGNSLIYQPLNRSRNEIRLITISPPRQLGSGLDLCSERIECKIQHVSLDDFVAKNPRSRRLQEETREEVREQIDLLRRADPSILGLARKYAIDSTDLLSFRAPTEDLVRFFQLWRHDKAAQAVVASRELDSSHDFALQPSRLDAMRIRHKQWAAERTSLLHEDINFFGSNATASFGKWAESWIWSPLSGHAKYAESASAGYLALSYVWNPVFEPYKHQDLRAQRLWAFFRAGGLSMLDLINETISELEGGRQWWQQQFPLPSQKEVSIIVDGCEVMIGENLAAALQALREIPEVRCGMGVWVDSLCIDQGNNDEKSVEVKRMGEIYRKASRVVSFLGRDVDDLALEVLNAQGGDAILSKEDTFKNFLLLFRNLTSSEVIYRITAFLCNPYWCRIWIAQEIALANPDAVAISGPRCFKTRNLLFCGSHSRHFFTYLGHMTDARTVIRNPNDSSSPAFSLESVHQGFRRLQNLAACGEILEDAQSLLHWSTIWFRIPSESDATDSRDFLYGMVNLLPSELMSAIRVDYSPDWRFQHVMTDFAVWHIKLLRSLDWIFFRPWKAFAGETTWPSWVPSLTGGYSHERASFTYGMFFAQETEADFDVDEGNREGHGRPAVLLTEGDDASRAMSYKFFMELFNPEFDIHRGRLVCVGFLVDVIRESSTDIERYGYQLYAEIAQLSRELDLPDLGSEYIRTATMVTAISQLPDRHTVSTVLPRPYSFHGYDGEEGLKSAISQCFNRLGIRASHGRLTDLSLQALRQAGFDESNEDWHPERLSVQQRFNRPKIKRLVELVQLFGDLDLWGHKLYELFAAEPQPSAKEPKLEIVEVSEAIERMFTTCTGFVGVAMSHVRAGDHIFVLPGSSMPVVLQPSPRQDDAWELVGPVFIPGLMGKDGEYRVKQLGIEMERLTLA